MYQYRTPSDEVDGFSGKKTKTDQQDRQTDQQDKQTDVYYTTANEGLENDKADTVEEDRQTDG